MILKKIGFVLKKDSDEARQLGDELNRWFAARGVQTQVDRITPELDLLIILGGDGTLLHVADQASEFQVPVVGVNLGGLGFLTDIAEDELYGSLEMIMAGEVPIEDRLMLKVRLLSSSGASDWRYALNDVVISKGAVDRLVCLRTWADEQYITTYRADGLIFSSPTGSTAYNLSAGGPIVHPNLRALLVTPICPFMLESRPVLLPHAVRLITKLDGAGDDVKVIVDGQYAWQMKANDQLEVLASDKKLRLIGSSKRGYFEILRNKLNWGRSPARRGGQD